MNQKLIAFFSVVIMLTACNSKSSQPSESGKKTETAVQLPDSFYKKLSGSIGDIAIVMDLTKNDNILSGSYYYTKIGIPLALTGRVSPDGKFSLTELNSKHEETGKFTGSFSADQTISGGLLFLFDQYEIGVYAMGAPEVFIAYKDIDKLIKPNGLLEAWRKK